MQVLVNSDHHIVGGKDLTERVQGVVEGRLDRFQGRIARVVVHLSDLDSSTRGDRAALLGERDARKTLRCLMEARAGGLRPIAVSHEAATITEAIHVAADKLERALEHTFGKLASRPTTADLPYTKVTRGDGSGAGGGASGHHGRPAGAPEALSHAQPQSLPDRHRHRGRSQDAQPR